MARGGARTGAGRKKGVATRMNEAARAKVAAEGITPLEYLLGLLRDDKQPQEIRTDAAKAAAPYVHAKLANVESNTKLTGELTLRATKEQRDAAVSAALRSTES
jgi:hypothetical protein